MGGAIIWLIGAAVTPFLGQMMSRILVVEDNPEVAVVLGDMLGAYGHACSLIHNAKDALAALEKGGIDVVVADVRLPGGVSGIEIAQRARAAGIGCVMITGYFDAMTDLEKRQHCIWLPKPSRGSQLADAVAAALLTGGQKLSSR